MCKSCVRFCIEVVCGLVCVSGNVCEGLTPHFTSLPPHSLHPSHTLTYTPTSLAPITHPYRYLHIPRTPTHTPSHTLTHTLAPTCGCTLQHSFTAHQHLQTCPALPTRFWFTKICTLGLGLPSAVHTTFSPILMSSSLGSMEGICVLSVESSVEY